MAIKNQKAKSFHYQVTRKLDLNYLLFLPAGYEQDREERWPLILFLHGAGERGANLSKVALHGLPKLVKTRADFPFILISPQCPAGESWSDKTDALFGLIDDVARAHRVDPRRIYLTGLSMGGFATWAMAVKDPRRFAAIVPICGGGSIVDILLASRGNEGALKKLPVWAFHGAKDPIVPVEESEHMTAALRRIGNEQVKLTIFSEAGHDCWTEAYEMPELFEWLLQQTRPTRPSKK
jgi:predicted peptidase